jgi:hypothetical protein
MQPVALSGTNPILMSNSVTNAEIFQRYGLPAAPEHREEIRQLLSEEITRASQSEEQCEDAERLRLLCVQLFGMGNVEDSLLIWQAKTITFDTFCGLDIQFLCGAGLETTKVFLQASSDLRASDALEYLLECETTGDFLDWTPQQWLANYHNYFGVEQPTDKSR